MMQLNNLVAECDHNLQLMNLLILSPLGMKVKTKINSKYKSGIWILTKTFKRLGFLVLFYDFKIFV